MAQGEPAVLQQAGPHERGAQSMEGERGEEHPDRDRAEPGGDAESLPGQDQGPQERVEQNQELVPEQLEIDWF